jgi:hypothetical protein
MFLLLYDSKCSLCRSLAYKIHFFAENGVQIVPLSSPEAHEVLNRFYPDGWPHDFYVVQNDTCRRGVRALPALFGLLGPRRTAAIMAEYGYLQLSKAKPQTCGNAALEGIPSKRNFLKLAALSPLLYGFSRFRGEDPIESPRGGLIKGFQVNVAEVERNGDKFSVRAYECDNCKRREAFKGRKVMTGMSAHLIENATLREQAVPHLAVNGSAVPHLKVKRVETETQSSSGASKRQTVYAGLLDHPSYGLSVSAGDTQKSSVAAMARHDVPLPVLDFVIFRTEGDDSDGYFAAYARGVEELERLHAGQGRREMVQAYREIRKGLLSLQGPFRDAVGGSLLPTRNELLLTSMPEALKFYRSPVRANAEAGPCDCSCSCATCCGCGCTLGVCISPLPCDCDCCIGCGCGCGCCAGAAAE